MASLRPPQAQPSVQQEDINGPAIRNVAPHQLLFALLVGRSKPSSCSITDYIIHLRSSYAGGLRVSPEVRDLDVDLSEFLRQALSRIEEAQRLEDIQALLPEILQKGKKDEERRHVTPSNAPNSGKKRKRRRSTHSERVANLDSEGEAEQGHTSTDKLGDACLHFLFLLPHAVRNSETSANDICVITSSLAYSMRRLVKAASTDSGQMNERYRATIPKLKALFPRLLSSTDTLKAERKLLLTAVHDIVELFYGVLTAINETAITEAQDSLNSRSEVDGTTPSTTLKRKSITNKLCDMFVFFLNCLDPDNTGHLEIFEGVAVRMLNIIGQRLKWAICDAKRVNGNSQDGFFLTDGENSEEDMSNLAAQTPYLIRVLQKILDVAAKFPGLSSEDDVNNVSTFGDMRFRVNTVSKTVWIKLQHTLLKAVFGEHSANEFNPSLHEITPPSDILIETQDDSTWDLKDPSSVFKKEVWRILGWDVLGVQVNRL